MKKITNDSCRRCGKVLFSLNESSCHSCGGSILSLCDDCDTINSENEARCQNCTARSLVMLAGAANRF
ncbi:MAG: hypothetical protein SCM11_17370 [Bacillota bacterium]|nr:hypothetical protein [Bacillota bacterium]